MIREAKTSDLGTILSTESGIRAVTKCFLGQEILTQFSAAREALEKNARVPRRQRGRRAGNDVDDGWASLWLLQKQLLVLQHHWRKGRGHSW